MEALLEKALRLLKSITSHGYEAYVVGGAVRDFILNSRTDDVDIATSMPMDELQEKYEAFSIGGGHNHGTMNVPWEDEHFEVTQFRKEVGHTDGRRPDKVEFGVSLADDLMRRDFTIGGMVMNRGGEVIDMVHGNADLFLHKIIRSIGNAEDRVNEDYLRMMRAPRFAAKYSFLIEDSLDKAIRDNASKIRFVHCNRILSELMKAAKLPGPKFAEYIRLMEDNGLLGFILPEVMCLTGYAQEPMHHPEGDVLQHTYEALKLCCVDGEPILKLGVLFHDLGKARVFEMSKEGRLTYHGHEEAGLKVLNSIFNRLNFSSDQKYTLKYIIGNHMRALRIKEMRPHKVFTLVDHPNWSLLKEVIRCDKACRGEALYREKEHKETIAHAEAMHSKWREKATSSNHVISGSRVIELTKLAPGPMIGRILAEVTKWAIDNDVLDQKKIEDKVVLRGING